MKKIIVNKTKLFTIILLLLVMVFSSCDFKTASSLQNSEAEESTEVSSSEVHTVEGTPYSPEMELTFLDNFGLITEEVRLGYLLNEPKYDGTVIGRFYSNTGMQITSLVGDFYLVNSGDLVGYVPTDYVLQGAKARAQLIKYGDYWAEIQSENLNVREKPNEHSAVLAQVKCEQVYCITGEDGNWFSISLGEKEGYISKDYCRAGYTVAFAENYCAAEDINKLAKKAIEYGMKYLGTPYVFGGEDLKRGCDCSYFTAMCMYQAGIKVGRTSYEQSQKGKEVEISDLQPGDLVFYKFHGNEIDHVALYIGEGKIIQAAQSIGCICIAAYNYCGEPCLARRYFE